MTLHMKRISKSFDKLKSKKNLDVVVIGSGYGASIAAARLAGPNAKVVLLERGKEILPGEFPTDIQTASENCQVTTAQAGLITGPETAMGMMDIRMNADMNVVIGCGLGGTSLINANVALETKYKTFLQERPPEIHIETDEDGNEIRTPIPRDLEDPDAYFWPKIYREKTKKGEEPLAKYYERAREMLGSNPLPDGITYNKLEALEVSAREMERPFGRPPINVTFKNGKNAAGLFQAACNSCGDCVSGCNYGAKNTTLMNYLPYAYHNGAEIVTEAKVTHLSKNKDGLWVVHVIDMSKAKDAADGQSPDELWETKTITAKNVILGAGSLGTAEILLRSAENDHNLDLPRANLGQRFSGNGDVLAFGYDAHWNWKETQDPEDKSKADRRKPIYGIGAGTHHPNEGDAYAPGPCITGMIQVAMEEHDHLENAMIIEEGVSPGALSLLYPLIFFSSAALEADLTRFPDTALRLNDAQKLGSAADGGAADFMNMAYEGAVSRTQTFLVMSHDNSGGQLILDDTKQHITVHWPGVGTQFPYNRDNVILQDTSDGIWANYIANPIWSEQFGHKLVTVHPVGGTVMAETSRYGVVNPDCQVFTGKDDTEVHEGLLVVDGGVIPTSLGLNPLLTISAVAERAIEKHIERNKNLGGSTKPDISKEDQATIIVSATEEKSVIGPSESDIEDTLLSIRGWLQERIDLIKTSPKSKAVDKLLDDIKDLATFAGIEDTPSYHSAHLIFKLKFKSFWNLKTDISPALKQIVETIDLMLEEVSEGKFDVTSLLTVLTEEWGSLSPDLSFDEVMHGYVCDIPAEPSTEKLKVFDIAAQKGIGEYKTQRTDVKHPISNRYEIANRIAETDGKTFIGHFTVQADNIESLLEDRTHAAKLSGYIDWRRDIDKEPIRLTLAEDEGVFNLLLNDETEVATWLMEYSGLLEGADKPLYFRGKKTLVKRPGSSYWNDLTTLFVDIHDGSEHGEIIARGMMTLNMQDFAKQMTTFKSGYDTAESDIIGKLIGDILFHNNLSEDLRKHETRQQLVRKLLSIALNSKSGGGQLQLLQLYYQAKVAGLFGMLIFRTYGGLLGYLYNFPAQDNLVEGLYPKLPTEGKALRHLPNVKAEAHFVPSQKDERGNSIQVRLMRYQGGMKGPVILAPGFAVDSMSYAMETVKENLVDALCKSGYDVWLFDFRGSPALGEGSTKPFTIDDIALHDWPAAIDYVLSKRKDKTQVQVMAHCFGSVSLFMSLLAGKCEGKIAKFIASQATPHPVTNWFNKMKADTRAASWIVNGLPDGLKNIVKTFTDEEEILNLFNGLDKIDGSSKASESAADDIAQKAIDMLVWKVPFPHGEPCNSPTCHRMFGIYGPIFDHRNINRETHQTLEQIFGEISTTPFLHLAKILREGKLVDAEGRDVYMEHIERLDLPITFIAGAHNLEFTPDSSLKTYQWLTHSDKTDSSNYRRHVFSGYAHMDCFIGRNAYRDIFPFILQELEEDEEELVS